MKKLLTIMILSISGLLFASGKEAQPVVEAVLNATEVEEGISFTVFTGGCTFKDDFEVVVNESQVPATLKLVRTRPDLCLGYFPEGVEIDFTWTELGLQKQPVWILNPLQIGN